jgi:two-component system sensor histidine kinase/response regulator
MTLSPVHQAPGHDSTSPAVNHADGVARLMGDAALFARVLARFRQEYRHAAEAIRGALAAGDIQLALRLAHTLKGAAGMIEAVPLREEAHALEQELRHGGGDPGLRVMRLERALEGVLRELDAEDGAPPAAS